MSTNPKFDLAGRTIALLFAAQWMVFEFKLRSWDQLEVTARFFLGHDFEFLYAAAGYFLSGRSPYVETSFVPLPPALYLPLLLHRLPFWNAAIAFRAISFFLALAAILWLCRELRLNALNFALILVITLTYGPFYSVLVGGNLDALMLVFLVFACARNKWVRGVFLGISIGTKLYSLLLIPVLVVRRRWRELICALVTLVILLVPFLRYMPDAFSSVFHRTSVLRLSSNESPAVLFILLFGQARVWAWRSCYVLLWGGTLLARLIADSRDATNSASERFRGIDYLPWMAGAPLLVFTYTGTILLPFIVCLVKKSQERKLNWAEWTSISGFLLTGIYSIIGEWVLVSVFPTSVAKEMLMIAAPLGISMMLIGSSLSARKSVFGVSRVKHGARDNDETLLPAGT